jgi:phosphoribosylanthranilate isomerase
MKIKICGITRLEDALLAEQAGADFLGFIFHPASPRYIEPNKAKAIINKLSRAKAIGVFVDAHPKKIEEIAGECQLSGVQVYAQICHELPKHLLKIQALRIKAKSDCEMMHSISGADFYLLDKYHDKHYGGTGEVFDWALLPNKRDKIFLAGGICHDNIKEASALKPYAIDICSGVEQAPGIKDPDKLKQIFREIHLCN